MRAIKTIAIVASVALVAMAFAGASSAGAASTKLCKKNEASCSALNTYSLVSEFKGTAGGGFSKLTMPGLTTVNCSTGKLSATLHETAGPLAGEIAKWNGFSCTPWPETCTLTAPKEPTGFSAEVEATSEGNGVLRVGLGPTLVAACTGAGFSCTYTTSTMQFPIKGGVTASFSTEASVAKVAAKSSLSCPSTATYAASLRLVEPGEQVFVTH